MSMPSPFSRAGLGKYSRAIGYVAGGIALLATSSCHGNREAQTGTRVHKVLPGQAIRLAFVPNAPAAFWDMAVHGLHKFEKETGQTIELKQPPTGSVEEQNKILEDLESQGYNGVALSVIAPEDQVRELNQAGLRMNVVTMDSDAPRSTRLAFVGPKQFDAGAAAGKEILRILPQGGKVAFFCGDLTAENAVERVKGIKSVIRGKNIDIVATKEDGKDRTRARAQVEDVITAYPGVNVLVGLWSYNGPAIRDALVASDKAHKIHAVVFDDEAGTLEGLGTGVIDASVVMAPFDYGYRSAQLLYQLATRGTQALPPNGVVDTGFQLVTGANLQEFLHQKAEESKW